MFTIDKEKMETRRMEGTKRMEETRRMDGWFSHCNEWMNRTNEWINLIKESYKLKWISFHFISNENEMRIGCGCDDALLNYVRSGIDSRNNIISTQWKDMWLWYDQISININ